MTSRSNRLLGPETRPCVQSESHINSYSINNRKFPFSVDTGASCNLLSSSTWRKIGTPTLQKDETRPLISASNDVIPTSDSVDIDVTLTTEDEDANSQILPFTVTDQLDILGTNAINSLQLTIRNDPVKVNVTPDCINDFRNFLGEHAPEPTSIFVADNIISI